MAATKTAFGLTGRASVSLRLRGSMKSPERLN